jgi:inorganic triphosphatase YgiF
MNGTAPASHKEIELKLEFAPATPLTLKKIPLFQTIKAPPKRASQVSVYFDTDEHQLRQKGLMLRVRREGRRYTQTIKSTTNSGLF